MRIFRLVTTASIEEVILERSRTKLDMDKKVIQGGRFDHKSTAEERESFLRAILEGDGEEEAEEEKENELGDDELNDILARGDDEADIFARMDAERARAELAQWRSYGQKGPPPERLITEAELPAVFRIDPAKIVAQQKASDELQYDEATGRRIRHRNAPTYDEEMTEEQWTAVRSHLAGGANSAVPRGRRHRGQSG